MRIKLKSGIKLDVAADGNVEHPAVIMISGLGMQLVDWPPDIINSFLKHGYFVIRFDNRDVGLSDNYHSYGAPNIPYEYVKQAVGLKINTVYTIQDMANDVVDILDALKVKRAHVLGVSMGGMIAQRVALSAPERVLSLTCIMSSGGVPEARSDVLWALTQVHFASSEADRKSRIKDVIRVSSSPGYPMTDDQIDELVERNLKRSAAVDSSETGHTRQLVAIADDGKRLHEIHEIKVPTLVIHGEEDPMIPFPNGQELARLIPSAKLVAYPNMGHDFPPALMPDMTQKLLTHFNENDIIDAQSSLHGVTLTPQTAIAIASSSVLWSKRDSGVDKNIDSNGDSSVDAGGGTGVAVGTSESVADELKDNFSTSSTDLAYSGDENVSLRAGEGSHLRSSANGSSEAISAMSSGIGNNLGESAGGGLSTSRSSHVLV